MSVHEDSVGKTSRRVEDIIASGMADDLAAAAADPRLTEDLALSLLARRDLPARALELISRNRSVMKHRAVLAAIAGHPRTPRWVAVPVLRKMFTFELMRLTVTPAVAPHVKMAADEVIVSRLESVSSGERMTLAKQGSRALAAALLNDPEPRISEVALDSPRLTEGDVVKALLQDDAPQHLIAAAARHSKWQLRSEVQIAILKHPKCSLKCAIEIANCAQAASLRKVLEVLRSGDAVKDYLESKLGMRP